MYKNPPDGWPRISASLYYEDPGAALDWLAKAFGFTTRVSHTGPDGQVAHAEMELGDGLIMVGPISKDDAARSPRALGGSFTQVVFTFDLTPELFRDGIILALAIGLIGGIFPAWRSARVPVVTAFNSGE